MFLFLKAHLQVFFLQKSAQLEGSPVFLHTNPVVSRHQESLTALQHVYQEGTGPLTLS